MSAIWNQDSSSSGTDEEPDLVESEPRTTLRHAPQNPGPSSSHVTSSIGKPEDCSAFSSSGTSSDLKNKSRQNPVQSYSKSTPGSSRQRSKTVDHRERLKRGAISRTGTEVPNVIRPLGSHAFGSRGTSEEIGAGVHGSGLPPRQGTLPSGQLFSFSSGVYRHPNCNLRTTSATDGGRSSFATDKTNRGPQKGYGRVIPDKKLRSKSVSEQRPKLDEIQSSVASVRDAGRRQPTYSTGGIQPLQMPSRGNMGKQPTKLQFAEQYELPPDLIERQRKQSKQKPTYKGDMDDSKRKGEDNRNTVLGWKKLEQLKDKDSNEILLTLCLPTGGLTELLENIQAEKRDLIALLLIVLSKSCASAHRNNVLSLLSTVTRSKNFMFAILLPYLASFQFNTNKPSHIESMHALLVFLEAYQNAFPASASTIIQILAPHLTLTYPTVFSGDELKEALGKVKELNEQCQTFLKNNTEQEKRRATATETLNYQQPPENYREIPILPTRNDILEHMPFLRPNIVNGKYENGEHYLDVQFRLLREDYIRPLREGIATFHRLKSQSKPFTRNKDVRIYPDALITHQEFFQGSLIHIVQFDIQEFSHIKWEHSKRFLTGSLLCFSLDDFDTMLFASVAFRDCEKLKQGILIVRFEELTEEVLSINPLQKFLMLETTAYFEAYRHNLAALVAMADDNFPFEKYIVQIEKQVASPAYLTETSTYDMSLLLEPIGNNTHQVSNLSTRALPVRVLDDSSWPDAETLSLDDSQYKALKTAITKEFAIIQGPPGTGKTYVGLRVVQLLLQKLTNLSESGPILIVCYTNHALDQFLEGIERFTQNIVRVGGRCVSETLTKYTLANLKKTIRQKRMVPHHIFSNVKHQYFVLDDLRKEINKTMKDITKSSNTLLCDDFLKPYMEPQHYRSLKDLFKSYDAMDDGVIVTDWLGIRQRDSGKDMNEMGQYFGMMQIADSSLAGPNVAPAQQVVNPEGLDTSNNAGFSVTSPLIGATEQNYEMAEEDDNEDDVEFLEGMRDVETEDFSGVVKFEEADHEENEQNKFVEDWRLPGKTRKDDPFIRRCLNDTVAMSPEEAKAVINVWNLAQNERWRLYKYWMQKFVAAKQVESYEMQLQIQTEYQKLSEMRMEEDLFLLKQACIIGMTTTGAAKYRDLVQNIKPRVVVIEEAAEILEAHIITTLVEETEHVILIGDHQQLRPSPNVYELATKFSLNVSLFERLVKNGMDYCQLTVQHRMHPSISKLLVPHIYPRLLDHESVQSYKAIKGIEKSVFFVSHNHMEGNERDSTSRVNEHEAKFLVQLCKYLLLQGYNASQITILTTYSGQLFSLKRYANKMLLLKGVRITVVDNFQGEENDIILLSFVRSNDEGNIGFLKVSNRVCVALSRAKRGLYCIGNFNLLAESSSLWKNITGVLANGGMIGKALRLNCQNHSDVFTDVSIESDFNKVPEGGCTRPCDFRLKCGHTCTRTCHSYDREHVKVECRKRCSKIICELEHQCQKKCFEKCGACTMIMKKVLPQCQHEVDIFCHIDPREFKCTEKCTKTLRCGHGCELQCGQTCSTERCEVEVEINLLCGHKVKVGCNQSHDLDAFIHYCQEKCGSVLRCGHICAGSCGECYQKRLHKTCRRPCRRILVCGHVCKSLCSSSCPPCKKKCENRCIHSKCPRSCGESCEPCREPCAWSCAHKECTKPCGELCSREPCDEPCMKILKCGHSCIGLCGEPCPKLCAVCEPTKVREIFFGTEDDEDARFVELEDCGHVLEVGGLTNWMSEEQSGEIQMKSCPRCKTVIRKNLRFGNIIKTHLLKIESVKKVIYGDVTNNKMRKRVLMQQLDFLQKGWHSNRTLSPMMNWLEKTKKIDSLAIIRCENVIRIAEEFNRVEESLERLPRMILQTSEKYQFDKVQKSINHTRQLMLDYLSNAYATSSEEQVHDATRELLRFKLLQKLDKHLRTNVQQSTVSNAVLKSMQYLPQIINSLCRLSTFEADDEKNFCNDFTAMCRILGGAVINVSEEEKQTILTAMNLTQGHWYQCPNGHVYCITECGGATVEGKCNECNETIGGTQHTLRASNRVATDMDGARHSAWPPAANMENYVFD